MPVPRLAQKLPSQVVIAASFMLLMSCLHKHNKSCPVCSGKNVTYSTSEELSGNKQTNKQREKLLLSIGTHSRQDILNIVSKYARKIRQ